jgi:hypothetical protein
MTVWNDAQTGDFAASFVPMPQAAGKAAVPAAYNAHQVRLRR